MLGPNGEKSKPSVGTREEYKFKGSMHITVMYFLECYYFLIFHKKIGRKFNSLLFKPTHNFLFLTTDLNCHPMPLHYLLHEC